VYLKFLLIEFKQYLFPESNFSADKNFYKSLTLVKEVTVCCICCFPSTENGGRRLGVFDCGSRSQQWYSS